MAPRSLRALLTLTFALVSTTAVPETGYYMRVVPPGAMGPATVRNPDATPPGPTSPGTPTPDTKPPTEVPIRQVAVDLTPDAGPYRLRVGTPFAVNASAAGLSGSATWALSPASTLPGGARFEASGPYVGGTLLSAGSAAFGFTVSDSVNRLEGTSADVSVTVYPPLSLAAAANLNPASNAPYAGPAATPGGVMGSALYALYKGGSPSPNALTACGMALDEATGALSGNPTRPCSVGDLSIRLSDIPGDESVASNSFSVTVPDAFSAPASVTLASQTSQAPGACTGVPVTNLTAYPLPAPALSLTAGGPSIRACAPASNACGASLPAGGTCNLGLQVNATLAGTYSGAARVTVGDLADKAVAIGGSSTYTPPALSVASTLTLATKTTSSAGGCTPLAVTNTSGTTVSDLSLSLSGGSDIGTCSANPACGSTLAPNATCHYGVRVVASTAGSYTATGTLSATGQAPQSVSFTGSSTYTTPVAASSLAAFGYALESNDPGAASPMSARPLYDDNTATYVTVNRGDAVTIVFAKPVIFTSVRMNILNPTTSSSGGMLEYAYFDPAQGDFVGHTNLSVATMAAGAGRFLNYGLSGTATKIRIYNRMDTPLQFQALRACDSNGCPTL